MSPGFKALAAAQTARHAPLGAPRLPRAPPRFLLKAAVPRPLDSPFPPGAPPPPGPLAPLPLRGGGAAGSVRRGQRGPHSASDPAAAVPATYGSRTSWNFPCLRLILGGGRACALVCACAKQCGLVRARAPRPRLVGARDLLRRPRSSGWGRGRIWAFPAPGCAGEFQNVPAKNCASARWGCPGQPAPRAPFPRPSSRGCRRGFPGPLLRRGGRKAQAVGRRARGRVWPHPSAAA